MLWVNLPVADIIDLSCISTNNGTESSGQKFSKGMKMSTPSSLWCYCSYSVCTEVECGKSPNLLTKHQVCYGCDWIVRRFSNEYTVLYVAFFVGDIDILLLCWTCYQANCHNEIFELISKGWLHCGERKEREQFTLDCTQNDKCFL